MGNASVGIFYPLLAWGDNTLHPSFRDLNTFLSFYLKHQMLSHSRLPTSTQHNALALCYLLMLILLPNKIRGVALHAPPLYPGPRFDTSR